LIPLFKTMLEKTVAEEVTDVLRSGWIGQGNKVNEFERRVANFLGVEEFVATNSCTAALHLAVRSLGLQVGSKVVTTPITFVSTNMVLLYEGLVPYFVDVERSTGHIEPGAVMRALDEEDVAAIMVVHLGGQPAHMSLINDLAEARQIPVIEDCAHAFGSTYVPNVRVGNTNNLCCWSFHAVKNLPLGDGGGVSTNDGDLARRLRQLRWLGIDKSTNERSAGGRYSWEYDVGEMGYKYQMNDIAATIGLGMLPHVLRHNQYRRTIAEEYVDRLVRGSPAVLGPTARDLERSACHFIPLFFMDRDAVTRRLDAAGVQYGMHYKRNDRYEPFRAYHREGLLGATWYENHELTLPLHLGLTTEDIDTIVEAVRG
jgi:perosamine synthetase